MQKDGITMRLPLGPVIAAIFMVELERNLLPMLSFCMTIYLYKRYVYDTIVYVKTDAFEHVLSILNLFHVKFDSLTSN